MFQAQYPRITKGTQVDTYHGVEVSDPFRQLEFKTPERDAWLIEENKLTERFLQDAPQRSAVAEIVTRMWNYPSATLPVFRGGRWFGLRNFGDGKAQRLCWAKNLGKSWRKLVDPPAWSDTRSIGIRKAIASPDGKLMAYAYSWGGADRIEWQFCDVDTRVGRPDRIETHYNITWRADSKAIFYVRSVWVTTIEDGKANSSWHPRVFCHVIGTSVSDDYAVAQSTTGNWSDVHVHPVSDKYLFMRDSVSGGKGAVGTLLFVDNRARETKPFALFGGRQATYYVLGEENNRAWIRTNLDAPRSRVLEVDLTGGEYASYREIIPQQDFVMNNCVRTADGMFVAEYLDGPVSRLFTFDEDGSNKKQIQLPTDGCIFEMMPAGRHALISFDSIAYPNALFKLDPKTGRQRCFSKAEPPGFDHTRYETTVRYARSKDGTAVPVVLVHRKGIVLDGNNPTLMYGYGGFNIPVRAEFSKDIATWLEMGGVYASVSTRGGGEFGEEWYRAGTKLQKQNVFDDFIAAAEWLISEGITSPKKLAIYGASNGGLLTAVCMQQRPDLFAAVISRVGVHDLIRYHIISNCRSWAPDYGTSDDEAEFKSLLSISPVHNVRSGPHPAILIVTGINDDRVNPGHSLKLLAALQDAHGDGNLILGLIDMDSGHGSDSPDDLRRITIAMWTFLAETLGMTFSEGSLAAAA